VFVCASRPGLQSSVISFSTQLYGRCIWDLPMLCRRVRILPCDYLTFTTITTTACDHVLWITIARHQKWPTSFTPVSLPTCLLPEPRPKLNVWYSPLLVTSSDVFDGATSSTPVPRAESMKIYQKLPPLFSWDPYEEQFKSWFNTLSPVRWELSQEVPLTHGYNISNWWANVLW